MSNVDIRRYTAEERAKVDADRLYTSPALQRELEGICRVFLGRRIPVHITRGYGRQGSFTDGSSITVDSLDRQITSCPSLDEGFKAFMGLFYHELAHMIYLIPTRYEGDKALEDLENGRWPGDKTGADPKKAAAIAEIEAVLAQEPFRKVFAYLYHSVENRIADQRDEESLISDYPSMVESAIRKQREMLLTTMPSYERLAALEPFLDVEPVPTLGRVFDMVLEYARTGDVLVLDPKNRRAPEMQQLKAATPAIDAAVVPKAGPELLKTAVTETIIWLWPTLKDALDEMAQQSQMSSGGSQGQQGQQGQSGQQSQSSGGQGQQGQQGRGSNGGQQGQSSNGGSQGQQSQDSNGGQQGQSSDGSSQGQQGQDSNGGQQGQSSDGGSQGQDPLSGLSPQEIQSLAEQLLQALEEAADQLSKGDGQDGSGAQTQSQGQDGSNGQDQDATGNKSDAQLNDMLKSIVEQLAKDAAVARAENDMNSALNARVKTVNASSSHSGVAVNVKRHLDPTDRDRQVYKAIMAKVGPYSTRLQKEVRDAFADLRDGSMLKHRHFGRHIVAGDAYRPDGAFYAKKALPQDIPEMAISVLVDCSGSMSGERLDSAIRAGVLLHDFATKLGIPVFVAGHCANWGKSIDYNVVADFDQVGDRDKYRIPALVASGCNRDGLALEISAKLLADRPEDVKMLFIISDGQPNHNGYGGEAAAKDIQSIVRKYKSQGVEIFAAAIGSDKPTISKIYGDSFIDISDLGKLPRLFVRIVKDRILATL